MESETKLQRYRYPGPRPFATCESDIFFGRDDDIEAFCNLVKTRQLSVLSGRSGSGKSSLLNAGVIPRLSRALDNVYLTVRFGADIRIEHLGDHTAKTPLDSLTVATRSLAGDHFECPELLRLVGEDQGVWYWMKRYQWEFFTSKIHANTVYIFFDQFEELFTYREPDMTALSTAIAEVLYDPIPFRYRQKLADMDKCGEISDSVYNFLTTLPDVKIVIALRTDHVSFLMRLNRQHPNIFQNYYELSSLSLIDACKAIMNPAGQHGEFNSCTFEYEGYIVESMLESAVDGHNQISIATLQILCSYVEKNLVMAKGIRKITDNHMERPTEITRNYYETVIASIQAGMRKRVQGLIEEDLIINNTRNVLFEEYILDKLHIDNQSLNILMAASIVRKAQDSSGRVMYEIGDDSLVTPIQATRSRRLQLRIDRRRKIRMISIVSMLVVLSGSGYLKLNALKDEAVKRENAFRINAIESENRRVSATNAFHRQNIKESKELLSEAMALSSNGQNLLAIKSLDIARRLIDSTPAFVNYSIGDPNHENNKLYRDSLHIRREQNALRDSIMNFRKSI